MTYRHMEMCCGCGEPPDRIDEVGFTDEHELVIHWWCLRCRRVVYVSKPLSDCWRDCPKPDVREEEAESVYQSADALFLQSIGVRFPDDDKP
ncbi:MAG: hypothetical protein ABSG79_17345 [Bryobacteraceae bacterium]|jgi:hypothetical protein